MQYFDCELERATNEAMNDKIKNKIISVYPAQGVTSCERCGRAINWVALVSTPTGELRVGLDCAETLQVQNLNYAQSILKLAKKVRVWFKKYPRVEFTKPTGQYIRFMHPNAWYDQVSADFVKKYNPEIYQKLI